MEKENQRVRISKMMLKNALISLLEKKPLEKISVYEICQTAEINRTTFYKYYGNETDLLKEIADDFFEEFETNLNNLGVSESDSLERALEYLNEHHDTFRILVNSIPDEVFIERLFSMSEIREAFQRSICAGRIEKEQQYLKIFFFYGGYAIIRWWLNSDEPDSAADIARLLHSLGKGMRI